MAEFLDWTLAGRLLATGVFRAIQARHFKLALNGMQSESMDTKQIPISRYSTASFFTPITH